MSDENQPSMRDENGRFTSEGMKKNRNAKKDFTKEMATHITSQELYWCARMITEVPVSHLKKMVKDKTIDDESLLTWSAIKKAVAGDFKPMQFVVEMIAGKPKQQVDQKITEKSIQINVDADDMNL